MPATSNNQMRVTRRLLAFPAAVLLLIAFVLAIPTPAQACSCAAPSDIRAWVEESEAAFVGTLVEKRDLASGEDSIYVFAIERWVKGDAGDVIEVRSAASGAACGFEFWTADKRIGAILEVEGGELHGGLCSQVDPDVLIAAVEEPVVSITGIPRLIVGQGWGSARLSVLDAVGGLVTEVTPPTRVEASSGTDHLEMCPGGERFVQLEGNWAHVWSIKELAVVRTHDLSSMDGVGWVSDVSCRDRDASSIWIVAGDEFRSKLMELVPETTPIIDLPGGPGQIGTGFVVSQMGSEGDAVRVDVEDGNQVRLNQTPQGANWAISVAAHPADQRVALVETRFAAGMAPVEATLRIYDQRGGVIDSFEIPWETYSPIWLDHERVMVQAYDFEDWNRRFGLIFDLDSGQTTELDGWSGGDVVSDGHMVFAIESGSIHLADLESGAMSTLVTLPHPNLGPLLVLDTAGRLEPPTTSIAGPPKSTTPPLIASPAPGTPAGGGDLTRWIAGGAVIAGFAMLSWMAVRRPGSRPGDLS